MKTDDRYKLECGHDGRVVWVSPDEKTFCVRGVKYGCRACGKGSSGSWTPTVYCYSTEE